MYFKKSSCDGYDSFYSLHGKPVAHHRFQYEQARQFIKGGYRLKGGHSREEPETNNIKYFFAIACISVESLVIYKLEKPPAWWFFHIPLHS
jgi:hypothetical protein